MKKLLYCSQYFRRQCCSRSTCTVVQEPVAHLKVIFKDAFHQAFGSKLAEIDPIIKKSEPKFGDFQMNSAMGLKTQLGISSKEIAERIVKHLNCSDLKSVNVVGPGFVNVILSDAYISQLARTLYSSEFKHAPRDEVVVIDYSSPNVAKEMHIGHLRSTVIGDALARIYSSKGFSVIRQNHIGDWGTQFGMLTEMLIERGHCPSTAPELNKLYKEAKKKFDDDNDFKERSRRRVVMLQAGDEKTLELWRQLVNTSRTYFQQIYDTLEVTLQDSDIRGESSYNHELKEIVQYLQQQGTATESDGAIVVTTTTDDSDHKQILMIQKSDGGFGYATTDLAAIRHRSHTLKASRILYVVDARQSEHFNVLFRVARQSGLLKESTAVSHVKFGTITGEDGRPFKTREGDTIPLLGLLEQAIQTAKSTVAQKNSSLPESEKDNVARVVGIGAIKYYDLSSDRIKDYAFSWKRMLSLSENTAPYIQYAYTRIQSIFRKAEFDLKSNFPNNFVITEAPERALILKLAQYDQVLDAVLETSNPHLLCTFLYDLTTLFHNFYEKCPVLKCDNPASVQTRLVLCALVSKTIKQGLQNLGINCIERM